MKSQEISEFLEYYSMVGCRFQKGWEMVGHLATWIQMHFHSVHSFSMMCEFLDVMIRLMAEILHHLGCMKPYK